MPEPHLEREQWKSRTGFLMAAIGSAIGLGNIWRFPYSVYDNGGGAFLIPYLFALVTAGIPLMILEYALGHRMRASAPASLRKIRPGLEWLGWWSVIFVMFGIVLYYCVVISWCLNYVRYSIQIAWGEDTNAFFFNTFLQTSSGPGDVGSIRPPIILGLAVVWFLNWIITFKGVKKGIETANKVFIPLLFLLTATLVVWSITFKGADVGLAAYLKPNFSELVKPKVWIDAYSQIFFSLSLGFGIMIAYASYLPRDADVTGNAVITSVMDCGYAIFAGVAVFATLGYMSFVSGKPIAEVVRQSIGLAFVAYPEAIGKIPTFGALFGFIFFFSLVIAGLSSSISIIEAFTASVMDKFKVSRGRCVSILCLAGFAGGIVFCTKGGLFWLDIVDHFLNHYGLVTVGILECLAVGWLMKTSDLRDHVNATSKWHLGKWWEFSIRYLVPAILGVIVIYDLIEEFSSPYEGYDAGSIVKIGVGWLVLTLVAGLFAAQLPWRRNSGSSV